MITAAFDADVLVVGAGPAGTATAIRTARAGLRTVVVDRAHFPRDKPCAEYLSPETLRQLALLGVLDRVERLPCVPLTGIEVTGPRGARLAGLFAAAGYSPFRPTGLAVSRRDLDATLVAAAREAGAVVQEGQTVLALVRDRGAVVGAVLGDRTGQRTVLRARVTVGADGLRSRVARALGGQVWSRPARLALVAHLPSLAGLRTRAEMHVGPAGYVGLNPLGDGRTNVALVVRARDAVGARGDLVGFFLRTLETFPGVRDRISTPLPHSVRIRVTGPFAVRARRIVDHGALLVGDAAEFFDPFTGEGMCTALRGAALAARTLTRALASGPSPRARDLHPYRVARRRTFLGKWGVERLLGWGMLAPSLFDRAVARLERRGRGHLLIGVTGNFAPARAVLNPRLLAGMLW
jgi:flavin-dependent dehydrogenase